MALKPEELERDWIVNARVLHVDGHETAAATLAASWAREAGIPVVADLDEIYPGVEELIENIDYLIVSKDFSCRLMKDNQSGERIAAHAIALRVPSERGNAGRGWGAGLGRQEVLQERRVSRSGG